MYAVRLLPMGWLQDGRDARGGDGEAVPVVREEGRSVTAPAERGLQAREGPTLPRLNWWLLLRKAGVRKALLYWREGRRRGWMSREGEADFAAWVRENADTLRARLKPRKELRFYCHAGLPGCFCAYRRQDHVHRAERHKRLAEWPGWFRERQEAKP